MTDLALERKLDKTRRPGIHLDKSTALLDVLMCSIINDNWFGGTTGWIKGNIAILFTGITETLS